MVLMIHPPQPLSLHRPAGLKQRRSRARGERVWDDPDCHPFQGGLALPEVEDWLENDFPSDFEDYGGW